MKLNLVRAFIGIALVAAGTPARAAVIDDASPIRLESVQITQSYGVFSDFQPGIVTIAFSNQSMVPATDVVFDLVGNDGATIAQYNDVGVYPRGMVFRHAFPDVHTDLEQQLEVSRVTFADGSSWSAHVHRRTPAIIYPSE
jgi:hypothetical protein